MPIEVFRKVLEDYRDLEGGDLSLTPLVGDFLLDKYLLTRIEMIKKSRIPGRRLSVTTNGVGARQYDDRSLEYIVQAFDRLKISIYGLDSEEYKALTRRDEYDQTLESICRILRCSKSNVVFGIRRLKRRPPEDIAKWVTELEIRSGCGYQIQVTESVDEYANWGIFKADTPLPFDAKWKPAQENTTQCFIPLLALQITSSGEVSFCPCANFDASEQLLLGSILNDSLRDLYNSEKCKRLYSWGQYGVPEFCKACSFHMPMSIIEQWPTVFSDPPLN